MNISATLLHVKLALPNQKGGVDLCGGCTCEPANAHLRPVHALKMNSTLRKGILWDEVRRFHDESVCSESIQQRWIDSHKNEFRYDTMVAAFVDDDLPSKMKKSVVKLLKDVGIREKEFQSRAPESVFDNSGPCVAILLSVLKHAGLLPKSLNVNECTFDDIKALTLWKGPNEIDSQTCLHSFTTHKLHMDSRRRLHADDTIPFRCLIDNDVAEVQISKAYLQQEMNELHPSHDAYDACMKTYIAHTSFDVTSSWYFKEHSYPATECFPLFAATDDQNDKFCNLEPLGCPTLAHAVKSAHQAQRLHEASVLTSDPILYLNRELGDRSKIVWYGDPQVCRLSDPTARVLHFPLDSSLRYVEPLEQNVNDYLPIVLVIVAALTIVMCVASSRVCSISIESKQA